MYCEAGGAAPRAIKRVAVPRCACVSHYPRIVVSVFGWRGRAVVVRAQL